jgi:hypothetical protein
MRLAALEGDKEIAGNYLLAEIESDFIPLFFNFGN